jgi:hypothetical protein
MLPYKLLYSKIKTRTKTRIRTTIITIIKVAMMTNQVCNENRLIIDIINFLLDKYCCH